MCHNEIPGPRCKQEAKQWWQQDKVEPEREDKLLFEPSWSLEDFKPDTGRYLLRRVNDLRRPTGLGASKVKLSLSLAISVHNIKQRLYAIAADFDVAETNT